MGDSFSVELKKKASKLQTLLLKREPVSSVIPYRYIADCITCLKSFMDGDYSKFFACYFWICSWTIRIITLVLILIFVGDLYSIYSTLCLRFTRMIMILIQHCLYWILITLSLAVHIISQSMVINYNCCPLIKMIVNRRRTTDRLSSDPTFSSKIQILSRCSFHFWTYCRETNLLSMYFTTSRLNLSAQ